VDKKGKVGEHSIIDGDCDDKSKFFILRMICRRAFHN